jgi:hypothetical protein
MTRKKTITSTIVNWYNHGDTDTRSTIVLPKLVSVMPSFAFIWPKIDY